ALPEGTQFVVVALTGPQPSLPLVPALVVWQRALHFEVPQPAHARGSPPLVLHRGTHQLRPLRAGPRSPPLRDCSLLALAFGCSPLALASEGSPPVPALVDSLSAPAHEC